MCNVNNLDFLIGEVVKKIDKYHDSYSGNINTIYLNCESGNLFKFYHAQSCCETVYLEDGLEDLEKIIGSPLVMAEESIKNERNGDSETWTFYKFATGKGYATLRWYGSSNGHYSEKIDIEQVRTVCKIEDIVGKVLHTLEIKSEDRELVLNIKDLKISFEGISDNVHLSICKRTGDYVDYKNKIDWIGETIVATNYSKYIKDGKLFEEFTIITDSDEFTLKFYCDNLEQKRVVNLVIR